MRKLGLITAALLASSTVAGAWPWSGSVTVHTDNDRHYDNDHDRRYNDYDRRTDEGARDGQRYHAGDRRYEDNRFVQLAALPLDAKSRVDIGPQAGAFSRIRVQAVDGRPLVYSIVVRFMNGTMETLNVNRRVGNGEVFDANLNGRQPIAAIAIHGQPDGHSQLVIYGQ